MRSAWTPCFACALAAAALVACGGDVIVINDADGSGGGGEGADGGTPPPGTITTPKNDQVIDLDREHDRDDVRSFTVIMVVKGFVLAEPGRCNGKSNCGHLVLFIDGKACGSPNNVSSKDHIAAKFGRCPKPEGKHAMVVELRDDRDRVLATTVSLTVTVLVSADRPALACVSPANGAKIVFEHEREHDKRERDRTFPVVVSLTNATLAPPGRCGGNSNC